MAHDNPMFVISNEVLTVFNKSKGSKENKGNTKQFKETEDAENRNDSLVSSAANHLSPPPMPNPMPPNYFSSKIEKKTNFKWKWKVNSLIAVTLFLFCVVLELDVIPFPKLGFYCKDPALSFKYTGDTIDMWFLVVITVVVPFIHLSIVEVFIAKPPQIPLSRLKLRKFKQALFWYAQFLLGFLILLVAIQLTKNIVGEPRPHFFDTCKPNTINCTSGYITDYKCTNKDSPKRLVRDSYKSFPSGHSTLGFYLTVFLSWHLQVRTPQNDFIIVVSFQSLFLTWGIICSFSRVVDHRHHWWDVLVGLVYGVFMAVYTIKIFCKNFVVEHVRYFSENSPKDGGNSIISENLLPSTSNGYTRDPQSIPDIREPRVVK